MKDFTIRNAAGRLKQTGDLFAGVLGPGIALQPVLNRLADIFREEKIK